MKNLYYKDGTVQLIGYFSKDELVTILNKLANNESIEEIKTVNVNGFTSKDIKVKYQSDENGNNAKFTFYVVKNGIDYDFYYGEDDDNSSWWPRAETDGYLSPLFKFVPRGFLSCCENTFEFFDTLENAIILLNECGFKVECVKELFS